MKKNQLFLIFVVVLCTGHFSGMKREERVGPDFNEIMGQTGETFFRQTACDISDQRGVRYEWLAKMCGRCAEGSYSRYHLKRLESHREGGLHLIKMVSGQYANKILLQKPGVGYFEDFTDEYRAVVNKADALLLDPSEDMR